MSASRIDVLRRSWSNQFVMYQEAFGARGITTYLNNSGTLQPAPRS